MDIPAKLLWDEDALDPKPVDRPEVAPNCGAEWTSADPFFATSRFKWLRFPSDPRGTPIPAEPALSTSREGASVEVVPPLPTPTVFTVPVVGATRGWK